MSINLVIKVNENFNSKNNHILVYNSKTKLWETQSKDIFLNETKKELINKDKKIKELEKTIENLNLKIVKLAEIIKGEII